MRYKALSVCAIAVVVFFGLRVLIRTTMPQSKDHLAMLSGDTGQDASRNHLASLASIAAGALAFAIIPGRRTRQPNVPAPVRPSANDIRTVVRCPQCDRRMRSILVASGEHRGRTMWLCPQSPDCDVRNLARRRRSKMVQGAMVQDMNSGIVRGQVTLS